MGKAAIRSTASVGDRRGDERGERERERSAADVEMRTLLALKLLVLGATGRTGHEIVTGALCEGHDVTALVRDRGRLTIQDPRLRVMVGSATDPATVDQAVAGHDAVLCTLGPRSPRELLRSVLMRASVPALVESMHRHGVHRLVLLSALGAGESASGAPLAPRLAFRTILRQVGADKALAEDAVRASELAWTIVYPPALTNGPATGSYRHGERLELGASPKVSRADVAGFMLAQLADDAYIRKGAIVAS
jgi:putative NADH-flavin reductase